MFMWLKKEIRLQGEVNEESITELHQFIKDYMEKEKSHYKHSEEDNIVCYWKCKLEEPTLQSPYEVIVCKQNGKEKEEIAQYLITVKTDEDCNK